MTHDAQTLIRTLHLQSHPEGGYYRETYRSTATLATANGERSISTGIYFLLEAGNFSAFHRIKSDEMWHFYAGDVLEVIEIDGAGTLTVTAIGNAVEHGAVFQYVVKAGNWFASRVKAGGAFALVGCTVAPGFDFADFEMPSRDALLQLFPQHHEVIVSLTR